MIHISHIAIPYSQALFDLSAEKKLLEETYKDMLLVRDLCSGNADFRLMLKSPIILSTKKVLLLKSILEKKISSMSLSFFIIMVKKKREAFIPDMVNAFIKIYKDHTGIMPAHVVSTGPLPESVRKQISEVIRKETGKEVELTESVDDSLIGGFILQWEDKQYDSSILRQMKEIRRGISGY